MKNKVCIVLLIMFVSQTFFSCCGECPQYETYEKEYTDISLVPYDISGFRSILVEDEVSKNAFGLGISIHSESIKIANNLEIFSGLGFSTAMAILCECFNEVDYINSDSISEVKIFIVDEDKIKQDVTENFKILSYSNEYISLNDFISEKEDWQDDFDVKLFNHETIPNSTEFIVEVELKSGKVFSKTTKTIHFYNP